MIKYISITLTIDVFSFKFPSTDDIIVEIVICISPYYFQKWYSNFNSTFIALNLCQKTDSKAHHTKTLFNIHKTETLQGSALWRKQEEIGNLGWICFSKEV